MTGWHWKAQLLSRPRFINVPYAPHKIIVLGWGRLGRDGRFRYHQPSITRMHLSRCCPDREAQP